MKQSSSNIKNSTKFDFIAITKITKLVRLKGIYVYRDVDMSTATDYKQNAIRLIASIKF